MNTYEVTKECWVNGTRYLPTQLIKLTEIQAREWLDRRCIKELKQTKQARNTSQNTETAGGQSVAGVQTIEDK